jgi:hypothetical protein
MGGPESRPAFEISKERQIDWVDLFDERYSVRLWNDARAYES